MSDTGFIKIETRKVPPEEGFMISTGVSHETKDADCKRALRTLEQAGFTCAPTSDDTILELAEQIRLTRELEDNPIGPSEGS